MSSVSEKFDRVYRRVSPHHYEDGIPKHLGSFQRCYDDERQHESDEVDVINISCNEHGTFSGNLKQKKETNGKYYGISTFQYAGQHIDGNEISNLSEIKQLNTPYTMSRESVDEDLQKRLFVDGQDPAPLSLEIINKQGKTKRRLVKFKAYCCYEVDINFDESSKLELVYDNSPKYHATIRPKESSSPSCYLRTVPGDGYYAVSKDVLNLNWKFHCLHIEGRCDAPFDDENFDDDIWKCAVMFDTHFRLFTEETQNCVSNVLTILEETNYSYDIVNNDAFIEASSRVLCDNVLSSHENQILQDIIDLHEDSKKVFDIN